MIALKKNLKVEKMIDCTLFCKEMDEITDQFRTEDAEEFKQVQAELEVTGMTIINSIIFY